MSEYSMTYFDAQSRLTTWTDELEFLGYILCELIDAEGLDTTGYPCHQAADLPAIIDILRPQLKENGSLTKMMNEDDLKVFRRLMRKAKNIRNLMAHHNIRDGNRLNDLEKTKDELSDMLESAIRGAASDRGIYQVAWSPYHHICQTYMEVQKPSIVMVPLNEEPLLSFRDRILRDHDLQQRLVLYRRPKQKATEESRQRQKDDYEAARIRKQQRRERDIAMRSNHQSEKLHRIEQRFLEAQELGYAQLNKVKVRMREQEEVFLRKRAEILKDGMLHSTVDEEPFLITILLAISSPLWLTVVFIYTLQSRTCGRSECA